MKLHLIKLRALWPIRLGSCPRCWGCFAAAMHWGSSPRIMPWVGIGCKIATDAEQIKNEAEREWAAKSGAARS